MNDFIKTNADLAQVSKAVAGGLVAILVSEAARYGFQPSGEVVTAVGVVVTALVSYVAGHLVVYFAPRNKV
jgi:hypothetical protein